MNKLTIITIIWLSILTITILIVGDSSIHRDTEILKRIIANQEIQTCILEVQDNILEFLTK